MDFDSFSHGQIVSKLWLCEQLEQYIDKNRDITILGSWHNVLGFMLSIRKPGYYKNILGVDSDINVIEIADKITNAWSFGKNQIRNICENANDLEYSNNDVIINCSAEHFESNQWFDNIPTGTLVCIQSSDVTDPESPWFIRQPSSTIDKFVERYPLSKTHYLDTLSIDYTTWGYKRFMIIGEK